MAPQVGLEPTTLRLTAIFLHLGSIGPQRSGVTTSSYVVLSTAICEMRTGSILTLIQANLDRVSFEKAPEWPTTSHI